MHRHAFFGVFVVCIAIASVALSAPASACHPVMDPPPAGYYDHGCGGNGTGYVGIGDFDFRPDDMVVNLGDSVSWRWAGPDTNHSVTADGGQEEDFDSDPGRFPTNDDHPAGDTFSHAFTKSGVFDYHCRVHRSMRARVIVRNPDGSVPDSEPPRLEAVRISPKRFCPRRGKACRRPPRKLPRARFSVSELADVYGKVQLVRRARTSVRTVVEIDAVLMEEGRNSLRLMNRTGLRRLAPGLYRVALWASDDEGNESLRALARFRVTRR
jgi:plastocyanin